MIVYRKFKPFIAPLKIKFRDPDTKEWFHAKTKSELIQKIVIYRSQNELDPIENLDMVVDNYLCSLPENRGLCEPQVIKRGFMGYIKGAVTLFLNMVLSKYTTQEEAESRAETCMRCPNNVFPEKKETFLSWTDTLAYHSLNDRSTPYDRELGSCEVCTCPLRVKIWNGSLDKEDYNDRLPDFCWAKFK